ELDAVVLAELKKITLLAREHPQQFYEMAMQNGEKEAQKLRKESEQKRSKLEKRNKELDNIIRCLYEDRATGRITPERYDSLAAGYEKEQSELKTELAELSDQLDNMSLQEKYVLDFIEKAKVNIELKEVTPEVLRAFISRIEVYEKPEKYSRTCGNTILIRYTFQTIHEPAPILKPSENKTFAQAAC
ncbi:MAG: DUF4368 domain-containing protein, partial [Ruminococcus sp.]|nr:DUF4368 domain-containing protein [Ruminococcus sp.]